MVILTVKTYMSPVGGNTPVPKFAHAQSTLLLAAEAETDKQHFPSQWNAVNLDFVIPPECWSVLFFFKVLSFLNIDTAIHTQDSK